MQNFFAEIVDVVFNGRSAADATGDIGKRTDVNWRELIRRKKSFVKIAGKTYRVTVERVTLQAVGSEEEKGR